MRALPRPAGTLRSPAPLAEIPRSSLAALARPPDPHAPGLEVTHADGDCLEGVSVAAVLFYAVPLDVGFFGGLEDVGPVEAAFADFGEGLALVFGLVLEVGDGNAILVLADHGDGVFAALVDPVDVGLPKGELGVGLAEDDVDPAVARKAVGDLGELKRMVVVPEEEPALAAALADLIERGGDLAPAVEVLPARLGQGGTDDPLVADSEVVVDLLIERALEHVEAGVGTGGLEAGVAQELAHLLGGEPTVAGELNSVVADLGDAVDDLAKIFLELVTDGVELEGD